MMEISKDIIEETKKMHESKSILTKNNKKISKELLASLYNRHNFFNNNCKAYETSLWIESNENLIRQKGKKNTRKYYPKQIVLVDLGIDTFGHEFSYEHPCIIIYNNYDKAFIVPCTSQSARRDKNNNLYNDQLEGYKSNGFAKTTTILIKEARFIDKTRIKSVVGTVDNELYNKVYNNVFKTIFESKDYQLRKLIDNYRLKNEQLENIKKEKETLEKKLNILNQRYSLLTSIIKKIDLKNDELKDFLDRVVDE